MDRRWGKNDLRPCLSSFEGAVVIQLNLSSTCSATFQNFPQVQFLDKLMTSVVVQRLVPGRVGADNCGGSAVAWGPCGDSTGAVLGQV